MQETKARCRCNHLTGATQDVTAGTRSAAWQAEGAQEQLLAHAAVQCRIDTRSNSSNSIRTHSTRTQRCGPPLVVMHRPPAASLVRLSAPVDSSNRTHTSSTTENQTPSRCTTRTCCWPPGATCTDANAIHQHPAHLLLASSCSPPLLAGMICRELNPRNFFKLQQLHRRVEPHPLRTCCWPPRALRPC
jgi:hypothetical protein